MKKGFLCILLFAVSVFAGIDKAQMETFKKESAAMRGAIDDVISAVVPGRGYLDATKAIYLEGYGAVFTLEASLGPALTPFTSPKPPAEIRAIVTSRLKTINEKLQPMLQKRVGSLQSIGSDESVTVVIHLLNAYGADVPDLPSQIQYTVKKHDPSQVIVREF